MIDGVIIKKITKHQDDRGWLAEIFRNDESELSPEMGYISETKRGVVRGPHEHKEQTDFFIFLGPGKFKLYLWENREGKENYRELATYEFGADNPASVIIPAGVVHGYKCISDEPAWTINLPNKLYKSKNKNKKPDEVRWEAQEDSPFVIN